MGGRKSGLRRRSGAEIFVLLFFFLLYPHPILRIRMATIDTVETFAVKGQTGHVSHDFSEMRQSLTLGRSRFCIFELSNCTKRPVPLVSLGAVGTENAPNEAELFNTATTGRGQTRRRRQSLSFYSGLRLLRGASPPPHGYD